MTTCCKYFDRNMMTGCVFGSVLALAFSYFEIQSIMTNCKSFRGLYSPTKQPWNMGLEIYLDIIVGRCTELLRDIEQLVDGKEIAGAKNQHCFSLVFPSLATQMLMPSFRIRISSFRFPTFEFRGLHKPSFSVMYNVAIISCTL
jgi:hypothetical protein